MLLYFGGAFRQLGLIQLVAEYPIPMDPEIRYKTHVGNTRHYLSAVSACLLTISNVTHDATIHKAMAAMTYCCQKPVFFRSGM
jgi:hypothetical protein